MAVGIQEGLYRVSTYQDINKAITNEKLSRAGYPTFMQYYLETAKTKEASCTER